MKLLKNLCMAWKRRDRLGDAGARDRMAQFYPPALEIQNTPANPLARWVARSLLALFVLTVLWACFGQVDVVVSAEGKIIPSSRVKQIQPLEKAVVSQILVEEGEYVVQGQPLLELDATQTRADQTRLTGDVADLALQLALHHRLIELLTLDLTQQHTLTENDLMIEPASDDQEKSRWYSRLAWQQWQSYRAELSGQHSAVQSVEAEQRYTRAIITKLESTLPIIEKRTANLKNLYHKQYASEQDYLELEQARIAQTQDLAAERERLSQLQSSLQELREKTNALVANVKSEHLRRIAELQTASRSAQEELNKAINRNSRYTLYAPVAGYVQQLQTNTIGGVVTDAQQLMLIVPEQDELEAEVFLKNQDIGFVEEGMLSEIKIHTFPFTKYGVINGIVGNIQDDAVVDEQKRLLFGMRVKMQQDTMLVNGKPVKLIPGMSVTSEVKIARRRVVEFVLSPMIRHRKESFRER